MTKPTPAGEPNGQADPAFTEQTQQAMAAKGEQPPVTGVVSDQPGQAGNVPAGTEPTDAMGGGAPDAGRVEVTLAHHWTDPDTGRTYGPRDTARVSADVANSLEGAKYLLAPEAAAALAQQRAQAKENAQRGSTPGGKDGEGTSASGQQPGSQGK